MGGCVIALAAAVGGCLPAEPTAVDPCRYYVLLFGGQATRGRPNTAHTWATYVRAVPQPDGTVRAEPFTISWLPPDMNVRPLKLRPGEGRTFTLHQTLDHMVTGRHEVSLWGPFETTADHYGRAARYKQVLDSGAIRFRTLDGGDRRPDINHCVHAITYSDPALKAAADPILSYGELVTRRVAEAMAKSGVVSDPTTTHDWLIPALGIDGYDITRRRIGEARLKFRR
jgi:hypothetical protein